jgi:predicted TPR repeat methyltransferase
MSTPSDPLSSAPSTDDSPADDLRVDEDGAVDLGDAFTFAQRLHQRDMPEQAAQLYTRIIEVVPDHAGALHYLGVALHQLGRSAEGARLIEQAIAIVPNDASAHANLGNVLKQQGNLDGAESCYERALALAPNDAGTLNNLGTVFRAKGRLEEAITLFRRAIELDPERVDARHNLGNVMFTLGRAEEGLDQYRHAIRILPYGADSYRRMGIVLCGLGRVEQALETFRKWAEIHPNDPEAQHYVSACTGQNVPARASEDFVRNTFDRFATSFDAVLERLQYQAPTIVGDIVEELYGAPQGNLDVLDAGCGTGLAGPRLRPFARKLVGVDLSPRMLGAADERKVYDELVVAELTGYLKATARSFDLVVSVDTLVYFGDLAPVAEGLALALRPGGHALFTLELASDEQAPQGYVLNPHGRYAHSESYVQRTLSEAGIEPRELRAVELRLEAGKRVKGLATVARRP